MDPRNVLFIACDQLRADAVQGRLGELIATPNLDRLRARSTTFTNHFSVTVPCGPARASLLTGRYAMNHRSVRNGSPLASYHSTIATEVRKAGLEPLLFGYTDIAADPGDRHQNDPDLKTYELPARGFREVVAMRFNSPTEWLAHLVSKGYTLPRPLPEKITEILRPAAESSSHTKITDPAFYRAEDSDTAFLTNRFLDYAEILRDRAWFVHLCYIRPHPPLIAPEPYNTLVNPDGIPSPIERTPEHPLTTLWRHASPQALPWTTDRARTEQPDNSETNALRAVYLGLVAELDHHIGRILDWLERTDQQHHTAIVFTSDHGDLLGDHGMWGKHTIFDQAFHIPLIICDPSRPESAGRSVSALTESIDIMPTLLDLLNLPPVHGCDGHSLTPWLSANAQTPEWRNAVFMEVDFAHPEKPTAYQTAWNLSAPHCNAAILRESRWKYVHFNGGLEPLLFDLRDDPDETNNLIQSAPDQHQRMMARMLDHRMTFCDQRLTGYCFGA